MQPIVIIGSGLAGFNTVKEFRKLDKDGNNLLDFEEWAVTTVDKFEGADADGDRTLTQAEFATTAPKRKKKPRCAC
mgnify:CR=1 FL=1